MNQIYLLLNRIIDNKKYHFGIFLLITLGLTSIVMYLYPISEGIDPYFHQNRLLILIEAIKNGKFPIYMDYNSINGYGYLCKVFYSDFTLIPYALIGCITNLSFAFHSLMFSSFMLCNICTYITVKIIYKSNFTATLSAILYTYSAYFIYQTIYIGAIGETISFSFIPLIILGLYEIIKGKYSRWYILSIAYSLIIMTHMITSVIMILLSIIIIIIYYKNLLHERKRIFHLIGSGLCSLVICSYYIFPMIEQMISSSYYFQSNSQSLINYHKIPFKELIINLTNILPNNNLTYILRPKLGGLLTILIFLRLFINNSFPKIRSVDLGVIIGILFIYANTYYFSWSIFPFNKLEFIQFPWRLFKFTTYFFAIAAAYYLQCLIKSRNKKLIVIFITIIFTIITFIIDSQDYKKTLYKKCEFDRESIQNKVSIGGGEYIPSKLPSKEYPFERGEKIDSKYNSSTTNNYKNIGGIISFKVLIQQKETLELPLLYYKGYSAYLNDKEIEVSQSENGLVEIPVNESGHIKVYYAGTTIQKVSFWITILSIITLCIYIYVYNRKRKENA